MYLYISACTIVEYTTLHVYIKYSINHKMSKCPFI